MGAGQPILENQWVTFDTGEQPIDRTKWLYPDGDGNWFRFNVSLRASNGDNPDIIDRNDGTAFFALDNFTVSFN